VTFLKITFPTFSLFLEAPTIAIDLGLNSGSKLIYLRRFPRIYGFTYR